ncbi:type VII secretion target [Actinomadura parmotrematis]|uniref:WXG100 family type VII secretion target n=1 Tax=Actinomadura parmotrematis TaxID=2864039 RepID=A0ABS7G4H9_9ACTN|nr:type VII secretion target [Actinomadura parmotrematis]MBW8487376.1 hypothetical protein [Actinomadura parmotrematis]
MTPPNGFEVDPKALRALQAGLDRARATAAEQRANASNDGYTDISLHTWGAVGSLFQGAYAELKNHVTEHLGLMEKFLAHAAQGLDDCAANYGIAEQSTAESVQRIGKGK